MVDGGADRKPENLWGHSMICALLFAIAVLSVSPAFAQNSYLSESILAANTRADSGGRVDNSTLSTIRYSGVTHV